MGGFANIARQFRWLLGWMGPSSKAMSIVGLGLAVVVATLSWQLPGTKEIERALFGLRYSLFVERADEDTRIVQIAYAEETLLNTGQRSPLDRRTLADALKAVDRAGAKVVAVDILLDTPQPDDAYLLEVLRQIRTPLVLAASGEQNSATTGIDDTYVRQLVALADNPVIRLASPKLQTDTDGVVRRWPETGAGDLPLIALSMSDTPAAFSGYDGPLRYRIARTPDRPVFTSFSIDLFSGDLASNEEVAALLDEQLDGRYILIGANLADIDQFSIPFGDPATGRDFTSGLDIQSHMLAQALDNVRYQEFPRFLVVGLLTLALPLGLLTGLFFKRGLTWPVAAMVQVVALTGFPFLLQAALPYPTYGLPAFGLLLSWLFAFALVLNVRRSIAWEQGKVAQLALTRYLPPDIAREILASPSRDFLSGDRRTIFTLFTDMEGFTSLCQRLDPRIVAELLNDYLERLSGVIIDNGGTIDKYVGDAVVAIWGAPLAREDDGKRAYKAALALYSEGEAFRSDPKWADYKIGRTRVGLHYGEAIVGNFGGKDRVHYTALGDTVNIAARLEGANKDLATKVLISEEVLAEVGGLRCRPMGSVVLRGRDAPIIVFEPAEHLSEQELQAFTDLYHRCVAGDAVAWAEIQALAAENQHDAALERFVSRMSAELAAS